MGGQGRLALLPKATSLEDNEVRFCVPVGSAGILLGIQRDAGGLALVSGYWLAAHLWPLHKWLLCSSYVVTAQWPCVHWLVPGQRREQSSSAVLQVTPTACVCELWCGALSTHTHCERFRLFVTLCETNAQLYSHWERCQAVPVLPTNSPQTLWPLR